MNDEQLNTFNMVLKEQARRHRKSGLYEELSRLNDELVKKNAELGRLNEQKNQLLGMTAHDLGTPLAIIIFYSQLLRDETANYLSGEHLEFLSIIRSSSEFMASSPSMLN